MRKLLVLSLCLLLSGCYPAFQEKGLCSYMGACPEDKEEGECLGIDCANLHTSTNDTTDHGTADHGTADDSSH